MSRSDGQARVDALGPQGPPRENGELVFQAPWESRVFAVTLSLYERGRFEWAEFQARLIQEIAAWEERHPAAGAAGSRDATGYHYWDHWLAALESLLAERELCAPGDLDDRVRSFAEREPGHDH